MRLDKEDLVDTLARNMAYLFNNMGKSAEEVFSYGQGFAAAVSRIEGGSEEEIYDRAQELFGKSFGIAFVLELR